MTGHADEFHPSTAVVALGRPDPEPDGALNPPIVLSSTFRGSGAPEPGERVYARYANPTWEPLESAIAALEGTEVPGLAFASGMAAVSAALSLTPIGGVAVVPSASYNGTIGLARELAAEGALELREVDPLDVDATARALDGADLIWLESPTNPMLDVVDLPALTALARERGATVVVDNTFSTPLRQRPLGAGADVVVHSATKFIAGHSDVLLGLAVTRDQDLRARLAKRRTLQGGIPGPFEAWLALRGLRTMALRLDRAEETTGELARRLAEHPAISRVRYPGLPSDPGHDRARAQLDGFGAVVSVELGGGAEAADAFVGALRLFTPATSLGGVESLVERRRRHSAEPVEVPESLVRLSIGIEHVEDLWADLERALAAVSEIRPGTGHAVE
ncbi:aminotransferase class I/II-fold pyridoxal phosphate-dependent enzyme [Leucobacter sp. CSA1]|uniref:homocysteine desulfhydrase n=1 Tax=Leucobacter chromiisoli TaxID=2796471 RepID=A0A934Q6Z3_9MICO|nr:aminotransferase class I/II-fold pyridoxal phosphate-dependent enzyme [Leucobacter chromiisoli]MBK0417987.1 aminotransferase class I/II-fold pyridoxal phosphate-dependent enzyme [Leucobacter chromiisoli]